jgi:hypothetical protein
LRAPPALKGRAIAVTPAILAIGTDIALEFVECLLLNELA